MLGHLLISLGVALLCFRNVLAVNQSLIVTQLKSPTLGLSPATQIFFRSDPNWLTETTMRYTVHDAPTYIASIKPVLESDIQKIVWIALTNIILGEMVLADKSRR